MKCLVEKELTYKQRNGKRGMEGERGKKRKRKKYERKIERQHKERKG
jgi:hypothetical protein